MLTVDRMRSDYNLKYYHHNLCNLAKVKVDLAIFRERLQMIKNLGKQTAFSSK